MSNNQESQSDLKDEDDTKSQGSTRSTYEETEFSDNSSFFNDDEEEIELLSPPRLESKVLKTEQPPEEKSIDKEESKEPKEIKLTLAKAMQGISKVSMTRKEREQKVGHLHRVVSLHLQRKGIQALIPDELEPFYCLAHLYLYDNKITKIQGLDCLPQLESLHLSGNRITRIQNLGNCLNLRRVYFGQNEIEVVEGLENLNMLLEIYLEHQRLPPEQPLLFCPNSLDSISRKLKVLNISGNQLENLDDLMCMDMLDTLNASRNNLTDLDHVGIVLRTLRQLRVVDLRDNPFVKSPKYKEKIVGCLIRLEVLDGKDINETTRCFFQRFCSKKAMRMRANMNNSMPTSNIMTPQQSTFPVGLTFSNTSQSQSQARLSYPNYNSPSPSFPERKSSFQFSTPISASPIPEQDMQMQHNMALETYSTPELSSIQIEPEQIFFSAQNQNSSNRLDKFYASRAQIDDAGSERMSEMAKIIFRLSNLSPSTDEQSSEGYGKSRDNSSYWNGSTTNNSLGVKESRPLSPLEEIEGGNRKVGSTKTLGSRKSTPLRRAMVRKLPPRNTYGAGRTLSPLQEMPTPRDGLDQTNKTEIHGQTYETSKCSLPPWPHITRKKAICPPKVIFMP